MEFDVFGDTYLLNLIFVELTAATLSILGVIFAIMGALITIS
jgi:hypothetical protein